MVEAEMRGNCGAIQYGIAIEEQYYAAARIVGSTIPRGAPSERIHIFQVNNLKRSLSLLANLSRLVRGSIINNYHLNFSTKLLRNTHARLLNRRKAKAQARSLVPSDNNYRYIHRGPRYPPILPIHLSALQPSKHAGDGKVL
jgi:hypothetical protein